MRSRPSFSIQLLSWNFNRPDLLKNPFRDLWTCRDLFANTKEKERRMINEIKVIPSNCIRQWRRCKNYIRMRCLSRWCVLTSQRYTIWIFPSIYIHSRYYTRGSLHKSDRDISNWTAFIFSFFFSMSKIANWRNQNVFLFGFNSFYKFVDQIPLKIPEVFEQNIFLSQFETIKIYISPIYKRYEGNNFIR